MDRVQILQLFVRIKESGSFTVAANALGISRSVASTAIQGLETRLGTRLLSRSTRHVALTPDGMAFHERCVRILAELEDAEALFLPAAFSPRGRLRVDVPSRMARLLIVPALPEFFQQYPDISLELGVTDQRIDLVHDGVDCAVRVGEIKDPRLIGKEIGFLRQINCASPGYLSRYGTPHKIADLSRHLAVRYASPLGGPGHTWEHQERNKTVAVKMRTEITVNNAEAYIAAALAGLGLIQVPEYDVAQHLEASELVSVLPRWRVAPMLLAVLYPRRSEQSRRVHAFIDWLDALCQRRQLLVRLCNSVREPSGDRR